MTVLHTSGRVNDSRHRSAPRSGWAQPRWSSPASGVTGLLLEEDPLEVRGVAVLGDVLDESVHDMEDHGVVVGVRRAAAGPRMTGPLRDRVRAVGDDAVEVLRDGRVGV